MTRERETIARITGLIVDALNEADAPEDLPRAIAIAAVKINALLALGPGEGLRLVPVEPTHDMIAAAMNCPVRSSRARYAAMLAAAPSPPIPNGEEDKEGFMSDNGSPTFPRGSLNTDRGSV